MLEGYTDKEGGIDGARWLRDMNDPNTLKNAGFTDDQIKQWQDYNDQPWVGETPLEKYYKAIIDSGAERIPGVGWRYPKGWNIKNHPEILRLAKEVSEQPDDAKKPDISLSQFTSNFVNSKSKQELDYYKSKRISIEEMAKSEYQRLYGTAAMVRSGMVDVASLIFSPARVLHPEVEFKDISGLEWGIGAAQVSLIVAPVASVPLRAVTPIGAKVATTGVQMAAGGAFTYATVKEWDDMSEAERAMAVGIDTLIIGSALVGIAPKIKRFNTLTGKTIDTSAKLPKGAGPKPGTEAPVPASFASGTQEIGRMRLLTEGGKVGAGWNLADDMTLIRAVSQDRKPLAIVEVLGKDAKTLKSAREMGLKVKYAGREGLV